MARLPPRAYDHVGAGAHRARVSRIVGAAAAIRSLA